MHNASLSGLSAKSSARCAQRLPDAAAGQRAHRVAAYLEVLAVLFAHCLFQAFRVDFVALSTEELFF